MWQPWRCTKRLICKGEPSRRSYKLTAPSCCTLGSAAPFLWRPHPPQLFPPRTDQGKWGTKAGQSCWTLNFSDRQSLFQGSPMCPFKTAAVWRFSLPNLFSFLKQSSDLPCSLKTLLALFLFPAPYSFIITGIFPNKCFVLITPVLVLVF